MVKEEGEEREGRAFKCVLKQMGEGRHGKAVNGRRPPSITARDEESRREDRCVCEARRQEGDEVSGEGR